MKCTLCSAPVGPKQGKSKQLSFYFTTVELAIIPSPLPNSFLVGFRMKCRWEWSCGFMEQCPNSVSEPSCHLQVPYANIKWWRNFQNVTRFLWRATLHFLTFLAEHQWKSLSWVPIGNEHDFSTAILNKYSITMLQVSVVSFSSSLHLFLSILILQLNMMAGRGLEKLASSTWLLFPFIKSELFESFSE